MADDAENLLIIPRLVPVLSLRPFVASSRDLKKIVHPATYQKNSPRII